MSGDFSSQGLEMWCGKYRPNFQRTVPFLAFSLKHLVKWQTNVESSQVFLCYASAKKAQWLFALVAVNINVQSGVLLLKGEEKKERPSSLV